MDAAIVLEDVEVHVPGAGRIFGPVSLRVGIGERWALLGPNGSGKTTLLSVAGAWRQPSLGRAWILGSRLGRADVRDLRARIGHVGHTVNEKLRPGIRLLDLVLTGRTSVLEPWLQTYTDADRDDARARLEQVGCLAMAERPLSACSQGERARIALARALFGRPELLLFDEPAAGLDLPAREQVVTAMEAAAEDGLTSVLATHHLEEVPPSTTHAALLGEGRIARSGPIEEVLTDQALGRAFGIDVRVERRGRRWSAFAP
jgi:iron complex transport system ATP-binding protein